jgi:hypothetical protein
MPVALRPPALVGVSGARVFEAAEHLRVGLVGGVPDGDAVLVVSDANVTTIEAFVFSIERDALGVVCISIRGSTARLVRVGGIIEVDVLHAGSTSLVTRLCTNGNGVLVVPIDDDLQTINGCLSTGIYDELHCGHDQSGDHQTDQ